MYLPWECQGRHEVPLDKGLEVRGTATQPSEGHLQVEGTASGRWSEAEQEAGVAERGEQQGGW